MNGPPGPTPPDHRLRELDAGEFACLLGPAMDIYVDAMNYPPGVAITRRPAVAQHLEHPGFRAVATFGPDETLLGFGYGYTALPGYWWRDQVAAALTEQQQRRWLSEAFELVELHVARDAQGAGLGQRQLQLLLAGAAQDTVVLSTPEGESRAWRLYRRLGFEDLVRFHRFPGDARAFGILGRSLPADPAPTSAGRART